METTGFATSKLTGAFLSLSTENLNVIANRLSLAKQFFKESGAVDIERHVAAIHLEDAVFTQTLNKGTDLYRYSEIGVTTPKEYFFMQDPGLFSRP